MDRIATGAFSLLIFASVAGVTEMLLPEGNMRRAAEALIALLSLKLLLETVLGLFGG